MQFVRSLLAPKKEGQSPEFQRHLLTAALSGGKGVTMRLRHRDGSVTDAATGEVVSGPDPDWVEAQAAWKGE